MVRKFMTAALILTLGLSAAGCGSQNAGNAGTAAHRWRDNTSASQQWAIQHQNEARGTLDYRGNGAYGADRDGRVDGYHARTTDGTRGRTGTRAGEDLKKAGRDLGNAAKNAARGVGDAAEDTLDIATGNDRNMVKR